MLNTNIPILYNGIYLPTNRSNENLSNNEDYINSAKKQVQDIESVIGINNGLRVLDFGCGQGRFANGIKISNKNNFSYVGIDTDRNSIDWCRKWVSRGSNAFKFIHLPAYNERYNTIATSLKALPVELDKFNLVYLNSVFSHMIPKDIQFYLNQFYNILESGGYLFATAFIENNVNEYDINPRGYLGKKTSGSLHRVRYERGYFLEMVTNVGFKNVRIEGQADKRTGQSIIVARKL